MTSVTAKRRSRGQALVEAALGTLVMVTILIFSVGFSETIMIALKLQEGATSAMWDSTARRHHAPKLWGAGVMSPLTPATGWSKRPAEDAADDSSTDATQRYRDLDGRRSANAGLWSKVFTAMDPASVVVECEMDANISYRPFGFVGGLLYMALGLSDIYPDNGGEACTASAWFEPIRIPQFLRQVPDRGWFTMPQLVSVAPRQICGIGRPVSFDCKDSRLTTMIDDWGTSGGAESQFCYLIPNDDSTDRVYTMPSMVGCPSPVRGMAHLIYRNTSFFFGLPGDGRGAASALANSWVEGLPPGFSENRFWISMPGEELTRYQQINGVSTLNPVTWIAGGGTSYTEIGQPFAGMPFRRYWRQIPWGGIFPTTPGGDGLSRTMIVPSAYQDSESTRGAGDRKDCFLGQLCDQPPAWWAGLPAG